MKRPVFVLIVMLYLAKLDAKVCYIGAYYINSKETLEAFVQEYGDCDSLKGTVWILYHDDSYIYEGIKYVDSIYFTFKRENTNLLGFNDLEYCKFLGFSEGQNSGRDPENSIVGFNKLKQITKGFVLRYDEIKQIKAFEALEQIGTDNGSIYLDIDSDSLSDISFLDGVKIVPNHFSWFVISDSPKLDFCAYRNICEYIAAGKGDLFVGRNAPGCNSHAEVLAMCATSSEEIEIANSGYLYPNPGGEVLSIRDGYDFEKIEVYDMNSKKCAWSHGQNELDVSTLAKGIYQVLLHKDGTVISERWVKM